jgi:hypothetical protein
MAARFHFAMMMVMMMIKVEYQRLAEHQGGRKCPKIVESTEDQTKSRSQ